MAGLILTCALALFAPLQRAGQEPAPHEIRCQDLLATPQPQDLGWRSMLFQSLTRLDHSAAPGVRAGWEALAADGGDADRSNLLLYLRRKGLPLPARTVGEGVDCALERALAAWGAGALEECRRLLREALAVWPSDARLASNLAWLERRPPASLAVSADARDCALAVLAARGAIP